jgi:hypothetical protein
MKILKRLLVAFTILIYAAVLFTLVPLLVSWIFFNFNMVEHFLVSIENLTNWAAI